MLLCLFLLVGCKGEAAVDQDKDNPIQQAPEVIEPIVDTNGTYELYVVFGVDSRNNAYGIGTRSDSIMLLGVNKTKKEVKIASILRDTLAAIEGHNYEKITHAHSYGGADLALKTINDNYDLDIKNYLTVNFNSVSKLIDLVGGIDLNITSEEVNYINGYIDGNNKVTNSNSEHINYPGDYHLDGNQALAYSRIRYTEGGDFKRSERQRIVISKIFEKAKEVSLTDKIKIADEMFNTVNTNVSKADTLDLLKDIASFEIVDMGSYPQVFYAGILETNGLMRYVEVPCSLIDMVKGLHHFFEMDYEVSENILIKDEILKTYESTPNFDISNEYGNHVESEDSYE